MTDEPDVKMALNYRDPVTGTYWPHPGWDEDRNGVEWEYLTDETREWTSTEVSR